MDVVITIVRMNLKPKNIQEITSTQMYLSIYIMCQWHFYQPVLLMQTFQLQQDFYENESK